MTRPAKVPDARPTVAPLDPDSDKGREVAARLSDVFAEVRESIAARKALAATAATSQRAT